ncbi:MAG: hypothetical protein ACLRTR_02415 [Clostridia bacterium]
MEKKKERYVKWLENTEKHREENQKENSNVEEGVKEKKKTEEG